MCCTEKCQVFSRINAALLLVATKRSGTMALYALMWADSSRAIQCINSNCSAGVVFGRNHGELLLAASEYGGALAANFEFGSAYMRRFRQILAGHVMIKEARPPAEHS